jgi:hypothetical protein
MAGSAKVAMPPRRNAKPSTTAGVPRLGRLKPMLSENGIRPYLTPSMNSISPTITAIMPNAISSPCCTSARSATIWNRARNTASGTTARNWSKNLTLT